MPDGERCRKPVREKRMQGVRRKADHRILAQPETSKGYVWAISHP